MKQLNFHLLIIAVLFIFTTNLKAQTVTDTVIQQACANDGIVAFTVDSGLTPPLTFEYYQDYYFDTIHYNVNSMSDTIFNIMSTMYSMSIHVYITDTFGNSVYAYADSPPPFNIDSLVEIPIICPDTIGGFAFYISGGILASNVYYYIDPFLTPQTTFGSVIASGNPINNLPEGAYAFIVVDSNGCEVRNFDDMGIGLGITTNIDYNVTTTEASCTNGTAILDSVSGAVLPYTFQWSNGLTTNPINNLSGGNYNITVTDSIGCSKVKYFSITQNSNISLNFTSNSATCTQNDGSITAYGTGGISPYTYIWATGSTSQTIDNLSSGNYQVTVTDAEGCFANGYINLNGSTPIQVTYSTIDSDCNNSTGSATLTITGGTTPYNVVWSTYPVQTGMTASNLSAGVYHFEVTDAVGCARTGSVVIQDTGNLSAGFWVTNETCNQQNGEINTYVSGSNPPFTFNWSNGETSNMIDSLQAGNYTFTVTDTNGCFLIKEPHVHEVSDMELTFSTNSSSCIFTPDGSISVNVFGGTPPYAYNWTGGQTTQITTNLLYGDYWCTVTDSNNCSITEHIYLDYDHNNDSCYCTVTGKVYVDTNSNCTYDIGEELIENIQMHCDYFAYNFTDTSGEYSFIVPTGTYELSEIVQSYYPLSSCQNNSITINANAASGCVITNDFAHVINPIHDIKIISHMQSAIPGTEYNQHVIIYNDGTITENDIQFGYAHDGQLQFTNSSITISQYSTNWYGINSGFTSLSPAETKFINFKYYIPANIPLGTEVLFYDSVAYTSPISNWSNDYSPWNNVLTFPVTIVGSFDPNNKEVLPKGIGEEGYITTDDSILTYTIHFENTGSYYASKVVVVDTLDDNLDFHTIHPGYSNHNYTTDLSEDGVLTFTFENIHLYWHGEAAKGQVSYTIKQKPSLAAGTIIENKASIFFDYNAPIITNTVINTIDFPENINNIKDIKDLLVYPNPTNGLLYFKNIKGAQIVVTDISGRILINLENVNDKIDISYLNKGIYIIKVNQNNIVKTTKIIKR